MTERDVRLIKNEQSGGVILYLEECLKLRDRFIGICPDAKLVLATNTVNGVSVGVRDVAVGVAFQCYSPGLVGIKLRKGEKVESVANSTLDAGHHTTRMHSNYTWNLIMSRCAMHDWFHNFPFYNSDVQSQRYVEATADNCLIPTGLSEEQLGLYQKTVEYSLNTYFEMIESLGKTVETRLREIYPVGFWNDKRKIDTKKEKIAQEVARYFLPVGQFTIADYTINEAELIRMFRATRLPGVSDEVKYLVARMVEEVSKIDSQILDELREPIVILRKEADNQSISINKDDFDNRLDGQNSKLLSLSKRSARKTLADSVRMVLGKSKKELPTKKALELLFDPEINHLLADVFEIGIHDDLTQCQRMVNITFITKLSHAADEQRHRHRRTPSATPSIETQYDGSADYYVPRIIREDKDLMVIYQEKMNIIFENINKLIEMGVPKRTALLLLPNAFNIRTTESGDLFDWIHRWKQRLCFTAQEEISDTSRQQVEQLLEIFPELGYLLKAPCSIRQRAGMTPKCPEGERWCGKPVWKINNVSDYQQERII